MRLEADQLKMWCRDLESDPKERVAAWRELHYLAQAVAEAGKSWGVERDDDSHSALELKVYDQRSEWGNLYSKTADHRVYATLTFEAVEIVTDGRIDADRAIVTARGRTLDDVTRRVRSILTDVLGDPRQAARPAPDLPEHPIGRGGKFTLEESSNALDVLMTLYHGTGLLLDAFVKNVSSIGVDSDHELTPRCWPHHFDLASLLVLARDERGAMTRTIGVGITPPDAIDDSGYWYVSPWSRDEIGREFAKPKLRVGRWEDRGSMAMAVLPIREAGRDLSAVVPGFVADAFNACMDHFEGA